VGGLLVYAVLYATAAVLIGVRLVRRRRFGRPVAELAWPLAYAGLALLSLAWSDVPELTSRRAIALIGAFTFAGWLAARWDLRRTFRAVAWALSAIAVASAVLLVADPTLAIHPASSPHAGDWRGALLHKNLLGREMALGAAFAAAFALNAGGAARWGWAAATVLMATLLVGSGSATGLALALALLAVVLIVVVPAATAWERVARGGLAVGGGAIALATTLLAAPALLAALGRDATFTGRDRIWQLTLERVAASPLGSGYGAFWDGPNGAAISASLGYPVGHAHNGWLEVAAQAGWLGAALVAGLVAVVAWRALRDRRPLTDPVRAGTLLLVAYALVVNVADATLAGPNAPTLVLLVAALLRSGGDRRSVA
jgi:O-antigen ligase